MLRIEDSIKVMSTSNGKKYYHLCSECSKEIGPNTKSSLKTRSGLCNSCFKKQQHPAGQSLLRRIHDSARGRTTVSLTKEQASYISQICTCHYCGDKIVWKQGRINLDRKNPDKGYEFNNVVVCCFSCNRVKSNVLSYEEMRIAMQAVRLYRAGSLSERQELEYMLVSWNDKAEIL